MDPQLNYFGECHRAARLAYGMSAAELVAKWRAIDPEGHALPGMNDRKRFIAASLCENMERSLRGMTPEGGGWSMNAECVDFFRRNEMLREQKFLAHAGRQESVNEQLVEQLKRAINEATTTASVPSIAIQMFPMVTRAIASNPIFDLVVTIPMAGPSANLVYEDVLYDDNGAYSDGTRTDNNEDPNFGDRTDCTANAKEIRANYQRETLTATEKVIAAQICLSAEQDAQAQFGVSIEERLRMKIYQLMIREWARLVVDDLRTLAGNGTSYSLTVPAPFTSLNTNEYRKVLAETLVVLDAAVQEDVYEPTTWLIMSPTRWAYLERTLRFEFDRAGSAATPGNINQVSGEFGRAIMNGRWRVYTDPFYPDASILMGLTQFTVAEHQGQAPYYFGAYQMADNVSMLFQPRSQVIELGGQTRAARKMAEPNAFALLTITA